MLLGKLVLEAAGFYHLRHEMWSNVRVGSPDPPVILLLRRLSCEKPSPELDLGRCRTQLP